MPLLRARIVSPVSGIEAGEGRACRLVLTGQLFCDRLCPGAIMPAWTIASYGCFCVDISMAPPFNGGSSRSANFPVSSL